ncbi:MAG: hypothetical protein IPM59_08635 [Chloracidobacterium sp.]|nr:hypothetical protein [Chloracidobacterium sp.]
MTNETCPRCHSRAMRRWPDLTDDEKMLAERLPASAEYTPKERKKHRICIRCWYEDDGRHEVTA